LPACALPSLALLCTLGCVSFAVARRIFAYCFVCRSIGCALCGPLIVGACLFSHPSRPPRPSCPSFWSLSTRRSQYQRLSAPLSAAALLAVVARRCVASSSLSSSSSSSSPPRRRRCSRPTCRRLGRLRGSLPASRRCALSRSLRPATRVHYTGTGVSLARRASVSPAERLPGLDARSAARAAALRAPLVASVECQSPARLRVRVRVRVLVPPRYQCLAPDRCPVDAGCDRRGTAPAD